jgi:hypothetical protein
LCTVDPIELFSDLFHLVLRIMKKAFHGVSV